MAKVLLVGIEPTTIDFSHPDYANFSHLTPQKVQESLDHDQATLQQSGYSIAMCLARRENLPQATADMLKEGSYDCVLVGAGVRAVPANLMCFEKVLNAIHEFAPKARICFNTNPTDSAEAVKRWV